MILLILDLFQPHTPSIYSICSLFRCSAIFSSDNPLRYSVKIRLTVSVSFLGLLYCHSCIDSRMEYYEFSRLRHRPFSGISSVSSISPMSLNVRSALLFTVMPTTIFRTALHQNCCSDHKLRGSH